jgi:transposase
MTTAETWAKRVEEWQASGQTSVAYSEGREFTAGGLRHWAHRLRVQEAKEGRAVTRPPVKLARVRAVRVCGPAEMVERPGAESGVAVMIGRARIVVGRGFDPSTLATVLAVLSGEGGR